LRLHNCPWTRGTEWVAFPTATFIYCLAVRSEIWTPA